MLKTPNKTLMHNGHNTSTHRVQPNTSTLTKARFTTGLVCLFASGLVTGACGSSDSGGAVDSAVGGTNTNGGTTTASGGAVPASGGTVSKGGASAAGGVASTGGAMTTGNTGGSVGNGGTSPSSTGGVSSASSGGAKATGGATVAGGTTTTGGAKAIGGTQSVGGTPSTGGAKAIGGSQSTGGAIATGGVQATGGAKSSGGAPSTGGAKPTGGTANTGGSSSKGGSTGEVVNGCPVKMEGWAEHAGTTGGGDATPQKVASVAELRTLSNDDVPRVLHLEGTYDLGDTYLRVGSNKTFLGIGKNAVVKAGVAGFSLRNSHNIILRNFTVQGGGDVGTEGGDAITATVAERLWFDHLTITDGPDGILDLTQGTTNATISWCKIYYTNANQPHRYAMQFSSGSGSGDTDKGKLDITMHHNWFGDLVNQRMPRHLWGRGHIYNSFYNSPGNEYCIGAGSLASLLIENNYFKDVVDPYRRQDNGPVHIVATGNVMDNATGKQETGALDNGGTAGPPPGPWTPPYAYSLDDAKNVPDLVKRCAGPQ